MSSRRHGDGSREPKTVSPRQRLNEFLNECLVVYGKEESKLFCNACREEKNIVSNHVASSKHKCSKEKLASRDRKERDIAKHLEEHVYSPCRGNTTYGATSVYI